MADNIIPRLLPEWLNSNQHRAYPLDESTVGNGLPFALLVDALFLNSGNIDSDRLYISSVVKSGDNVNISMRGYVDGEDTDFGIVAVLPFSTEIGSRVPITKTTDTYTLAGTLVIGNIDCMNTAKAVITLDEQKGKLFPGCVRSTDETLIGLRVNGVVYTGVVTLEAGDGVEFSVNDENKDDVVVKISMKQDIVVPPENMVIVDDNTLLAEAVESYGKPIRTICGVKPDEEGNITFATPVSGDEGEQYVEATGVGVGAISLTIANDTTDTKCEDNSLQVESLTQNIGVLNERTGLLEERVRGLEEAQSNLSLQISRS